MQYCRSLAEAQSAAEEISAALSDSARRKGAEAYLVTNAYLLRLDAHRSCVRDWSGILFETKLKAETEAKARKDIAESPTAWPGRPKKRMTKDKTQLTFVLFFSY